MGQVLEPCCPVGSTTRKADEAPVVQEASAEDDHKLTQMLGTELKPAAQAEPSKKEVPGEASATAAE